MSIKAKDVKSFIGILTTFLAATISIHITHRVWQIVFILDFCIVYFIYLSNLRDKKRLKIFFLVIGILIDIAIFSFSAIYSQIQIVPLMKAKTDLNGENINQLEINIIKQSIETEYSDRFKTFQDFMSNETGIELFYKTTLSLQQYYYCNIIAAFDECGIDFLELGIDENKLMLWDTEMLYILYNIREDIREDIDEDTVFSKRFLFNDYKVCTPDFDDTLDYGVWAYSYEEKTAKEIDSALSKNMEVYLKKLVKNMPVDY